MWTSQLLIWSLVLFGVVLGGFVFVSLFRRHYFQEGNFSKEGFTISDLRQMRDSGQMSAEEFEKAKAAVIGAQTENEASPPRSDKLRQ